MTAIIQKGKKNVYNSSLWDVLTKLYSSGSEKLIFAIPQKYFKFNPKFKVSTYIFFVITNEVYPDNYQESLR